MRISEKKQQELYNSMAECVTQMRIEVARRRDITITSAEADGRLFRLEQELWQAVKTTLNISEQTHNHKAGIDCQE
jgi:hypothetical protein